MGGREAWVELQYFTPLRNGFAVLAGVVVPKPQPSIDHGGERVEFECPLRFGVSPPDGRDQVE